MTRRSKSEIERKIQRLETRDRPYTDATPLIVPDSALPDEDVVDVPTDGICAPNPETGRDEIVVPHHRPREWRTGLSLIPRSHVAALWRDLTDEQLTREREIRDEHDHLIPPILENAT